MNWSEATWFDGRLGLPERVQVAGDGGMLLLRRTDGRTERFALAAVHSDEPFDGLPRVISLPGAGVLHTSDPLADVFPPARVSVVRLARSWAWACVCAVLLVGLVVALDQVVLKRVAEAVVDWIPGSADRRLGDLVLDAADRDWLKPSRLPAPRREAIRDRFEQATPGQDVLLAFRRSGADGGFNAFALPGNTIVLLDGMAEALTDDEIMWVLGHELGHVQKRHGMQAVARSFGLAALASTLWGDFSGWAAGAGVLLPMNAHGRDAEREADAAMRAFGARVGLPQSAQVSLWEKVKEEDIGNIPTWLGTHPSTEERLELAKNPAPK